MLQKYSHIGLKQNLLRSTTFDIITRLPDNVSFVCVHVVGRFSKDFSEVHGLRSRGFQLQFEWMTTVPCAEYTITLKMADKGWSDLHVVFTMILAVLTFVFGKLIFISELQIASESMHR